MYAIELAKYLHDRLGEPGKMDETLVRFESMRGYGLLPKGRENAALRLTDKQISSALMGFLPASPSKAGHVALCLGDLRPVGGPTNSIRSAGNLVDTISLLLGSESAYRSIVHATFSSEEVHDGSEFHASILVKEAGLRRTVSFVSKMALTLIVEGGGRSYDHEGLSSPIAKRLVLGPDFFRDLRRSAELSRALNRPLKTDWQEYVREEALNDFYRSLGATTSSQFTNVGVETHAIWPEEPRRVSFCGHNLVLFPKTKEYSHSISIDLYAERLNPVEARTLMSRFLSLLSWCTGNHAILRYGWSGTPVPARVPRHDLPLATAYGWDFCRTLPQDEELLIRLAYYREGLNAQSASIVSFEVLSFYKVFEVRHKSKSKAKTILWISENFAEATEGILPEATLRTFNEYLGAQEVGKFIYENFRVSTAHAAPDQPLDTDSPFDVRRLIVAGEVMRALAEHYITVKFGLSKSLFVD